MSVGQRGDGGLGESPEGSGENLGTKRREEQEGAGRKGRAEREYGIEESRMEGG